MTKESVTVICRLSYRSIKVTDILSVHKRHLLQHSLQSSDDCTINATLDAESAAAAEDPDI